MRFLEAAIKDGLVDPAMAARFSPMRAAIKDVRDMREHEDDYRLNKGQHRERYAYRDEESGQIVTAAWTMIHKGRYLIGGRVPLIQLSDALRVLHRDLQDQGYWLLPWGDLGLVEYGPIPDATPSSR